MRNRDIQRKCDMVKWERGYLNNKDNSGCMKWCDYCDQQQMETYCAVDQKTRFSQCLCAKAYNKMVRAEKQATAK